MRNDATRNNDDPDNNYQCHHIFPDDARCGSPRMRDEQFCYYHHDFRRPVVRPLQRIRSRSTFSLFTPTTHNSIQESLGEILMRLAANDIDPRRGALLLYGLQIASSNLRAAQKAEQTRTPPEPSAQVDPEPEWGDPS